MQFVAAGFDLARFWRLTPKSYALMMRGAVAAERARRLTMAEAARAGTRLDADDFETWVAAVNGRDRRMPPNVLRGVLNRAARSMETISMGDALKRMH
ncbi:hypothetical protein [Pseudotabrizicola algicola]|uniref:Uncharacterized protein n=1 Tax=Pseudotabrizicola algicola TaxID=2709381 RepID=A0A6B3RGK2_9RHOB|nr:hypothetical protein [Pseudotabrizicola algicola]NEX45184.1 hypothetical protein [Pseudotabrizicola algicola]